jgi:hypothetical protein
MKRNQITGLEKVKYTKWKAGVVGTQLAPNPAIWYSPLLDRIGHEERSTCAMVLVLEL